MHFFIVHFSFSIFHFPLPSAIINPPSLRPPSRNLIRVFPQEIPGQARDEVFSVLLSVPTERKNQERARCTLRVRQNHDSSHSAAGLASLKQVLAMPSAPCSIIGFYTFPSCYRNVIRSKDEDYSSFRPPSRNLFRVIRRRSRGKSGMRVRPP